MEVLAATPIFPVAPGCITVAVVVEHQAPAVRHRRSPAATAVQESRQASAGAALLMVAVAVAVSTLRAERLVVVGQAVVARGMCTATRKQRAGVPILVAVAVVPAIQAPRRTRATAVTAGRESSSCDTRFRPCRCQTLIRLVRHTTPVLRTRTTSLLSRLCVSRARRPSVPRCNLKWRRHLLPVIRTLRRAPGRILVRRALPIPRLDRGRAPRRHSPQEPPTSSALPRQRHWMARPTRRLRLQPYQ